MKNHELSNNTLDSAIETKWSDLEKMGEESFRGKKESANISKQKSPEQKDAELQLAAAKVRESFASRAEAQKEQPVSQIYNTETTPVTSALTPGSIIRKFISDRQARQIDKLANGDHKGIGHSQWKDRLKVISLVESGKVNLDNPSIANNYMRVKLSQPEYIVGEGDQTRRKTSLEKIEDMARVGIEPERPAMLIAESIVTKINDSLNKENDTYYDRQFAIGRHELSSSNNDVASLAEMSEIVEKYNIPEIRDVIRQNVDVQSFGDKAIDYALEWSHHYKIGEESTSVTEQIEQSRRGIDFLRKMGYEPFKDGVESLFSGDGIAKQSIAEELSLISEDTVDSMYQYKFRTLNNAISNHRYGKDMPILESLRCSGEDAFALFWEQRSHETGEDELSILAKKAYDHSSGSMIAEMAREYSESDGQENDPFTFILNNPNLLGGPDRGFIIGLNSIIAEASNKGTKEQEKRGSVKEAIGSVLRFQYENRDGYRLLFDEDGISNTAREMAIFDYGSRIIIKKFDPIWKSHFSSDMQEAIDSYRTESYMLEHPDLLSELTPRRKSLVELIAKHPGNQLRSLKTADLSQYFDEDGNLTSKLAEDLFTGGYYGNDRGFLCSCPEIYATLPPIQQRYLDTLHKIDAPKKVLGLSNQEIAQYFDEKGPKPEFWQFEFSAGDLSGMKSYLEKTATHDENGKTNYNYGELGLSKVQESVLRFYGNAEWFIQDLIDFIKSNELEKYFDENGPKDEFWQFEFSKGDFDGIIRCAYSKGKENSVVAESPLGYSKRIRHRDDVDYVPFGLSSNQTEALRIYDTLEDDVAKNDFRLFASDGCDEIPISRIKTAPQILNRLSLSNSSEITAHRSAFAKQLLRVDLDDDEKMFDSLERIEDVFIHNNLPFVGKAFLSFQILHPSASLDSDFNFSESSSISPSLKRLPNNAAQANGTSGEAKNRETVIFSDLLKASFRSNNRSIREYLENLRIGQDLINKLSSGEISWDRFKQPENDHMPIGAKTERDALNIFIQHLNTMYNNTDSGRKTPNKLTGDLEQDLTTLVGTFSPTERHNLSDRIVRSFAFFAGIRDFDSAETLLDSTAENATSRNKEAVKNGLKLERGDLVKGIGSVRYLPNILQNGSVAREFLGDSAGSDLTPLDTDLSIILENPDSISAGLGATEASTYGPVWLVLKGDKNRSGEGRFSITRRAPEEQNQQVDVPDINGKLEAFYTGAMGRSHYGIRTGFGSSEIDYFISGSSDINGTPTPKIIGLETALNGFYIPVLDKTSGDVVFSPEEYDEIREKMSGLSYYGTGEYKAAPKDERTLKAFNFNGEIIPSTDDIIAESSHNREEVDEKRQAIIEQVIMPVLERYNLKYKPNIDGDLTVGVAEVIDTGSTGRYSNAPHDGDFDFMMKLDREYYGKDGNNTKMDEIRDTFCQLMGITSPEEKAEALKGGNFRVKNVKLNGLDAPVDIDITFSHKTNKVRYSTDMALNDFYHSMNREDRENVVANVVFAKKFLKLAGAYKPDRGDTPQGGLGGVGVENWILQNGGSFLAAARDFMAVAEQCSSFDEFCSRYTIWDFGENHMAKGEKQHDNFVADNMSAAGYERMKEALGAFLAQQT